MSEDPPGIAQAPWSARNLRVRAKSVAARHAPAIFAVGRLVRRLALGNLLFIPPQTSKFSRDRPFRQVPFRRDQRFVIWPGSGGQDWGRHAAKRNMQGENELDRKTLYLHIGVHRTATSSIQAYLKNNREALINQGVLCPFGATRHFALANALFKGDKDPIAVADELTERADAMARPIHSVLLSDEDICMRARLSPFVQMRDKFNVKIVFSLRRQDLWLESWYLQNIKWQWDPKLSHVEFDEFLKMTDRFPWIDYDHYLGKLESDFGKENILLNVFEREQMPEGPVEAFCRAIGVDTSGFTEAPRRNYSLSPLMAEFVRRLPMDEAKPDVRARFERIFHSVDERLTKVPTESSNRLLTVSQRKNILKHFAPGNRSVAERYFGRNTLFFEGLPARSAPVGKLALPRSSDQLMERIIAPIFRDLIKEFESDAK